MTILETKRASWTRSERAAQWQAQKDEFGVARCAGWPLGSCEEPISLKSSIAEHELPVELGNTSKPDYLLCPDCAHLKTKADRARIAKARRQARETGRQRPAKNGRKIPSRPFPGWRTLSGLVRWRGE